MGLGAAAAALWLSALFASIAAAAPPKVVSTSFSKAGGESVTLEAEVNPEGNATQTHFEYGLADCAMITCAKTPNVAIGSGTSPVAVAAKVVGLAPGSEYHFRVVAPSTGGPANGPDATFKTHATPQSFGPCPNGAFRTEPPQPSATLPDCRAYEQVSPVQKNALDARGRVAFAHSSPAGDRIGFVTTNGLPGSEGGQSIPVYLASHGGGAWSTQGLLPPESFGQETFILGWTSNFSQVFEAAIRFDRVGGTTLLSRQGAAITTIVPYGGGLRGDDVPHYAAANAGGSLVLFEANSKLAAVPEAIEGEPNLYLWNRATGKIVLAGILNDKTAPPAGTFAGSYDWIDGGPGSLDRGGAASLYYTQDQNVLSSDDTKAYFTAGKTGQIYLRRNPGAEQSPLNGEGKCTDPTAACTLRVSASQKTNGTGPGGTDSAGTRQAAFIGATPDGKSAFLTSSEKLTNDANTGPEALPAALAAANIDGTNPNLGLLLTDAKGVTVDATHLYWTDPAKGTIGRANLDGSGAEPSFITGAGRPQYVAVDATHLYWTDAEHEGKAEGTIGRANLDGSGVEADFIKGATNPQGIGTDATYLYWSNAGDELETRAIGRAKLDGSEAQQEFIQVDEGSQEYTPQGLAADGTHIYAGINGTQGFSYFFRYDIDGEAASRKRLFDGKETEVKGIALDGGHVYWARQGADAIGRANLDLSEPNLEFIKAAGRPIGIAADAARLYWAANQENPPNPGNDLYRWDYEEATNSGKLSDVAPIAGGNGAEVVGVVGISADGESVYLTANGDLDGAGPGQAGDCKGSLSGIFVNFSGQCGLYLAREGGPVEFVARLDASGSTEKSDALDWAPRGGVGKQDGKTARVSPDGQTLLFRSQEQLSPYDNHGAAELYRYRAGEGITCVSCNPTGEAPSGPPDLGRITLSAYVPADPSYTLSRNLSADGKRVFFETTDALVGADTNGLEGCPRVGPFDGEYPVCLDAYEWEAQGTGSCTQAIQGGGCLYLLSSGKSDDASYLFDASASGDDVFLATRDPFVRQDQDGLYDVYDAHVEGGLASQNQVPQKCESLNACHPEPPPPPTFTSPGTATFSGPANPKPKQVKKKRRRKGKGHKKHQRRAKPSGRAGR